jgi:hypothetical protein
MKKILLITVLAMAFWACKQPGTKSTDEKPTSDSLKLTEVKWLDDTVRQLGKLTPNKSIDIVWRFKNIGKNPLVIESATASCGCTVPEKPEKPIAPGEEGAIKATFNGSGAGTILKQVYVKGNLNEKREMILSFTGEIDEK